MKEYAHLTKALTNQFKKLISWNVEADHAFQFLKEIMIKVHVLALLDF